MIRLLLLILKIIGITLASLLGLLIFLCLLVLFVPVRYRIDGVRDDSTTAHTKASWLFRIIHVYVSYENEKLYYKVRVFGYPLFASDKVKRKRKVKKKHKDKKHRQKEKSSESVESAEKEDVTEDKSVLQTMEIKAEDVAEDATIKAVDEADKVEDAASQAAEKAEEMDEVVKKKPGWFKKILNWIRSLPDKIRAFKKKIRQFKKTCLRLLKQGRKLKEFLFDEENKKAFLGVLGYIIEALKVLKPAKYSCNIEIGTGDPCTTGELLGIISMVHFKYFEWTEITPNFEEAVLKGKMYARGRIHGFRILFLAIKLIRDKKMKNVYNQIKHLKEEL